MPHARSGLAVAAALAVFVPLCPSVILAASAEAEPPAAAASVSTTAPPAAARKLTLREAVDLALRSDPAIGAAAATRDRSDLAVLRAQLDRFSLRIDSFLTEQWRASNFGGAPPTPTCAGLVPVSGTLVTPVQLLSTEGNTPSEAQCAAGMGQYFQPDTVSQGFLGQFGVSANLNVPLFTGFRVTSNVNRARHMRESATANFRDANRLVALAALRAYWAVRRLEVRQQVSEQAIARYDESVAVVAARVRAGLAAPADVNRIETRRLAERANLADLLGSAAEARAQLGVALGLGGTPLVLVESGELLPPPPSAEQVEEFLGTALRERPDLRAARFSKLAAADLVRFQLSSYFPQLSLSSLLQFSNNPLNPLTLARSVNASANPFTNISGSVFIGGTLSINLFDTLNTWTGVRDARFEERRFGEEERRLGRAVESEVRTLHARLMHYYGLREPLLRTRDIARDTLGIIERRYKNGDVAILDFIDAQVELLNSEIGLANSETMIAQTWGEFYLAMGRLPP